MTIEYFRINDLNDLEKVNPKEYETYPGYYYIPFYPGYVINRTGELIRLRDGFLPKPYTEKSGYETYRMIVNNRETQVRTHRLLALTFVGRPSRHINTSFSDLQVNHVDGDKNNNSLDNLEWVTPKENTNHAFDHGKLDYGRKKVIARDIRTNEEFIYDSIRLCEIAHDIKEHELREHLLRKNASTITKNWRVFKKADVKGWPEVPLQNQIENAWDTINIWYAHNPELNKTIISDNAFDIYDAIGIGAPYLYVHLKEHGNSKPLKGWYVETKREHISSETVKQLNRRIKGIIYPIKRINVNTGETLLYNNITEAAKSVGLERNALSEIIKSSQRNTYKDYQFEYYKQNIQYIKPKKPYDLYKTGYEVFNETLGSWQVVLSNQNLEPLILPKDIYNYSVFLGKEFPKYKILKHKDNDKTNDDLSNLEVILKSDLKDPDRGTIVSANCSYCGIEFTEQRGIMEQRKKFSKTGDLFCSMNCSIKSRAEGNILAEEEQARIKELRQSGLSIKEVRALTGYGENTIVKYQGGKINLNVLAPERQKLLNEMLEKGISINKISKILKMDKGTIRKYRNK